MAECPNAPGLDELKTMVATLVQKIESLIGQNYNLMRLMLVALIFLALGKGGLDIWREIKGVPAVAVTAAAQK